MSKVWARISGLFSSRTLAGVDKGGNRYFNRKEEIDGVIEWICWLNGQRKKAPTPEEMTELEARREHVRLNVARMCFLKKEEEERTAKGSFNLKGTSTGGSVGEKSDTMDYMGSSKEIDTEKEVPSQVKQQPESSEPTGSGKTYRPGTWQPPT